MSTGNNASTMEEESSLGVKVTEAIVLSLIICVCVIGNVSLWIVVLRSKSLRTVTSMFILGLSAADLFVATVNMPFTVYSIIEGYWSFSDDACVIFGFFNMLSLVSSVLSLCNISINRYFMVVKPNKFKDIYTRRNAIFMILGVYTVSILLSSPPLIGWSEYKFIPIQSFCFADWANHMSYAFFMIGCCFGIPFGVMTVCNILIFRTVQKSRQRVKMVVTQSSPRKSQDPRTPSEILQDESNPEKQQTQLSFTDVESFSVNQTGKEEIDLAESAKHHLKDLNESSTDEPVFWEINDMYKPKAQNNNNLSESDSSTQEEKSWSEKTLLKVETMFHSDEVRTVKHHYVDASMLARRSNEVRPISSESSKSDKSNKNTVSPCLLHPHWESKQNRITISSSSKRGTTDSEEDVKANIAVLENSATSTTSNVSEGKRKIRLPRSPSLRQREEVRLATTLAIIVIIFVICWLPYCVSMLLSIFHPGHVPRGFHMFTLLIGYANSGCNPIVYGVMNKRFKIGYKRLFCFCRSDIASLNSDSPSH